MRILHANMDNIKPSGVFTLLVGMLDYVPADIQFDFLGNFDLKETEELHHKYGTHFYNHGPTARSVRNWMRVFRVTHRIISSEKFDVVHIACDSAVKGLIFATASKLAGQNHIVIESHNATSGGSLHSIHHVLHRICRPLLTRLASVRAACSIEAASWLWGAQPTAAGRVAILPNGVDTHRFAFDSSKRSAFRRGYCAETDLVVGHMSNFSHQKNPDFLLALFDQIYRLEPDTKFFIAGSGRDKDRFIARASQYSFAHNLFDVGKLKKPEYFYAGIDVFVMPSLFEGLPMCALEAAASGTHVIASTNVSKRVEVTPWVERMPLSTPPSVWARKVLLRARESHSNLTGRRVPGHVAEKISIEKKVHRYIDIYTECKGSDR